jgi:hypothetical protein
MGACFRPPRFCPRRLWNLGRFGGPRVDAAFEKAYSFANCPMNGDEVGWADRAARPAVVTGPSNTLPADLAQDRWRSGTCVNTYDGEVRFYLIEPISCAAGYPSHNQKVTGSNPAPATNFVPVSVDALPRASRTNSASPLGHQVFGLISHGKFAGIWRVLVLLGDA